MYVQLEVYACHLEEKRIMVIEEYLFATAQVALAHAEMVNYQRAHAEFEQMRIVAPDRLQGLEVYSTVLWHLRKEAELSHLAQDAVTLDRWAPQTWCVAGNCFSLQGEHEHAIKLIKRAIQLDSYFTYAHTLCGHEHFANENLDSALSCFRQAIAIDERHYNAWYGIGIVFQRYDLYSLFLKNVFPG